MINEVKRVKNGASKYFKRLLCVRVCVCECVSVCVFVCVCVYVALLSNKHLYTFIVCTKKCKIDIVILQYIFLVTSLGK